MKAGRATANNVGEKTNKKQILDINLLFHIAVMNYRTEIYNTDEPPSVPCKEYINSNHQPLSGYLFCGSCVSLAMPCK